MSLHHDIARECFVFTLKRELEISGEKDYSNGSRIADIKAVTISKPEYDSLMRIKRMIEEFDPSDPEQKWRDVK